MATRRLYLEDAYLTEFSARVVQVLERRERPALVLDATCFYPNSGGQPCDTGVIAGVPVVDVMEEGEEVVHLLAAPLPEGAGAVSGLVNWERRFDHMQQHTGQHILSQSFVRTLGAETVSFHLGEEVSTIDLDAAGLEESEVTRAEDTADATVFANKEVRTFWVTGKEMIGLEIRGGAPALARLRIVEIESFDRVACGGTHCRATGEVGLIKVHRWEKVRGKQRVEFTCGFRALRDYRQKERSVQAIARLHNVAALDVVEAVRKGAEEVREARKRLEEVSSELLDSEAASLVEEAELVRGFRVVRRTFRGRDVREVRRLAEKIASGEGCIALLGVVGDKGSVIFSRSKDVSLDLLPAIKACCELMGGRGGGRPNFAQGGGGPEKVDDGLKLAYITLFD